MKKQDELFNEAELWFNEYIRLCKEKGGVKNSTRSLAGYIQDLSEEIWDNAFKKPPKDYDLLVSPLAQLQIAIWETLFNEMVSKEQWEKSLLEELITRKESDNDYLNDIEND